MVKLSRILLLSLLVVALASPMAFATTSRVASLGGAASYINDDSDIFRWYGTLPSYRNMVMAELGQVSQGPNPINGMQDISVDYEALGFTYNLTEATGTWGIFLLRNSIDDMSFFAFNPLGTLGSEVGVNLGLPLDMALDGLSTPTTKFVIMWGKELEQLSIGVNFSRSDISFQDSLGDNNLSFTTIGGGVRADLNDDTYLDGTIEWGHLGGDVFGDSLGVDKGNSWNIEARAFHEARDDLTLVPYFGWQFFDFALQSSVSPTTPPEPDSHGDKVNNVQFGVSLNYDVNSNNMLIFATELQFNSWKYSNLASGDQTEITQRTIPRFYIALESDINSWLTTRIGAVKNMTRTRVVFFDDAATGNFNEVVVTSTDVFTDDFLWTLGLGFHVAEWDIDLVLSEHTPFRLGYWLTGFGAGVQDAPVNRISATYRF